MPKAMFFIFWYNELQTALCKTGRSTLQDSAVLDNICISIA